MLTIHQIIEIQELLLDLRSWVEYDPGGKISLEVDLAFERLQCHLKELEKQRG